MFFYWLPACIGLFLLLCMSPMCLQQISELHGHQVMHLQGETLQTLDAKTARLTGSSLCVKLQAKP